MRCTMNKPRIFISYKGVNISRMERVRELLASFGAVPRCDKEFIREGENYLDRIPAVLGAEADAVICLVTKDMSNAPLQCKREVDYANQLHKPLFCIRYGLEDVDAGLIYPTMTADWIWIQDPDDRDKEAETLQKITEALQKDAVHLDHTDTQAVLLDQANDCTAIFARLPAPSLPHPFFKEILPWIETPNKRLDTDGMANLLQKKEASCILLTGEGGGGKSTFLRHLCIVLQKRGCLPVYIPVRLLNQTEYAGAHPLFHYIGKAILHLSPYTVDYASFLQEFFTKLCPLYPFVFLIDGYNEASSFEQLREDLFTLHGIPSLQMIVSSRSQSGFEQRPGWTFASALALTDEQIRQLNANHPVKILTDLNDRIFDLMRSPLLLTMMLNAYDREDYEALREEDLSNDGIADLINRCIIARLPKEDTRENVFLHAGIRILMPLAAAQMYFSGRLKDSIVDLYEISGALDELTETVLLPLRRRLASLLDMRYDIDKMTHAQEYMVDYARCLKEDPEVFLQKQIIPANSFLRNELRFLEGNMDEEMRWTHQTLLDWFIARGIALMARMSSFRNMEEASRICEDWMEHTASPITDQQTDPAYDDCAEIGELVYGMLKDTFFSRGYRNLLLNVSNANGLHKSTGTYAVTRSAFLQAERDYGDTPEKDPDAYVWLNGKIASAAYGLCHLNGGIPEGILEKDVVLDAVRIFEQCTNNLNSYPSATIQQQRAKTMELQRYGTLIGAAWQRLSKLSNDPAEQKELDEKALDISLRILKERQEFRKELEADPNTPLDQIREVHMRLAMSTASAGSCWFKLGRYDQALACQKEAMELRRQFLAIPAYADKHPRVLNQINENRVRILGCQILIGTEEPSDIGQWCEEFRALSIDAKTGNYYSELYNIANNFRSLLTMLEKHPDLLTEEVQRDVEETARILSDAYNSRRRDRINLIQEVPWVRLCTAPVSLSKADQIRFMEDSIQRFLLSKPFRRLLAMYHCPYTLTGDLKQDLEALNAFVERWDYRKGKERQEIAAADPIAASHRKEIMEIADALGMTRQEYAHITSADYILILGGANMANKMRVVLGKEVADHLPDSQPVIIALGAQRPLPEKEKENIREFAPDAETEFDAICTGMEDVFSLREILQDTHDDNGGILREWKDPDDKRKYYALCTPSIHGKRANTRDTFEHFLQLFQVPEKAEITLATTALYNNYQLLSLLPIALEHNIHLSITGRPVLPTTKLSGEAFLQEVKAAINAMYAFVPSVH